MTDAPQWKVGDPGPQPTDAGDGSATAPPEAPAPAAGDGSATAPPAAPAPPAAAADDAPKEDQFATRVAQLEKDYNDSIASMRAQLQELEARVESGQLTAAPTDQALKDKVGELRGTFEDWPQNRDELDGSEPLAQPWDLEAHGLPVPGKNRDFLPPGPNELAPVVVAHAHGILAPGMAGDEVQELARLLAVAGYPTTISRGTNHSYAFDDSVAGAVATFRRDYHVADDESGFPNGTPAGHYVGPFTWEALERVAVRNFGETATGQKVARKLALAA